MYYDTPLSLRTIYLKVYCNMNTREGLDADTRPCFQQHHQAEHLLWHVGPGDVHRRADVFLIRHLGWVLAQMEGFYLVLLFWIKREAHVQESPTHNTHHTSVSHLLICPLFSQKSLKQRIFTWYYFFWIKRDPPVKLFAGDIGGILGLTFGASILTVVELAEFSIASLVLACRRFWNPNPRSTCRITRVASIGEPQGAVDGWTKPPL